MKKIFLLVFGVLIFSCSPGGTGRSNTPENNVPGGNPPDVSFDADHIKSYETDEGSSLTLYGPTNWVNACKARKWQPLEDYKQLYNVDMVDDSATDLILLIPYAGKEYSLTYTSTCKEASSSVPDSESLTTQPYKYDIKIWTPYIYLNEGISFNYVNYKNADNYTLQRLIRSSDEELLTYQSNKSNTLIREYYYYRLSGKELSIGGVHFQFYNNGVSSDATLTFDPKIKVINDISAIQDFSSTQKTSVSLTTPQAIGNISAFTKATDVAISAKVVTLDINGESLNGFLMTFVDSDGVNILPNITLVKGKGVVLQNMAWLSKEFLGLDATPEFILKDSSKGP